MPSHPRHQPRPVAQGQRVRPVAAKKQASAAPSQRFRLTKPDTLASPFAASKECSGRPWTPQFEGTCADTVGPEIAPEKLLRSLLLEAFYAIPSEWQLIEQLGYNLLFRWFVGLTIDAPLWDAGVFIKDRKRLLTSDVAAQFLAAVLSQPRVESLLSSQHFCVDRALIETWTKPDSSNLRDGKAEPPASRLHRARRNWPILKAIRKIARQQTLGQGECATDRAALIPQRTATRSAAFRAVSPPANPI